jgi:3-polyprenyl-4-hydroxybenzoate decarboxylase
LDPTSKFTEIHNSHASHDKIQHHHLIQGGNASPKEECNNITKFLDNEEECKNSWTRRNAKISYSPYIISAHTASSVYNFPPAVITCSMRNLAILSRTSASNDLSRGCSSSPKLWI